MPLSVVPHSCKRVVEGSLQVHSAVSCFLFHSVGYLLCPLEPLWQGFNQNRHRIFETLGISCFLNKCSLLTNNKTLLKGEKPGPRSPCCQSPSVDYLEEGSEIIVYSYAQAGRHTHTEKEKDISVIHTQSIFQLNPEDHLPQFSDSCFCAKVFVQKSAKTKQKNPQNFNMIIFIEFLSREDIFFS